jgi:sugar-phosphatase
VTAAELIERAQGLLVDLDGTLVDSTAPVRRVWSEFARRHDLDPEVVHRFGQGRPSRETIRLLAPDADQAAESSLLERSEVADLDGVRALPGAHALLSSGRRLAIVTSCSRALALARLRASGLPVPEVLISSDDVTRGKPDPTCFRLGAAALGLEPGVCVVLEDAPAGITAGREAGAVVVALRTTHGVDQLSRADAVLEDLGALEINDI